MNNITISGILLGVAEHFKLPYWRGLNGKFYRSGWGGNGTTGGKLKAMAKTKWLASKISRGLFFTYAGIRAVDGINTMTDMHEAGDVEGMVYEGADVTMDIGMAALGIMTGPIGWGVAATYYVADEFLFDGNLVKSASQGAQNLWHWVVD